ncbi:MAG TPA: LysR family transcriptional regulator [Acetobacteraceae bacterium]|nr:LysR family transcriptional regulator [Acetobacteraceae bacterium]
MDRFAEFAAFVRTVERGSQSAAARDLGVTPAMVGRYLQALEDRLGTRLLNRTTSGRARTKRGRPSTPRWLRFWSSWRRPSVRRRSGNRSPGTGYGSTAPWC